MSHISQMSLPSLQLKVLSTQTRYISKGGRFAFENDTQHKCNDILKKYNQPIFLQLKDIISIFILFLS